MKKILLSLVAMVFAISAFAADVDIVINGVSFPMNTSIGGTSSYYQAWSAEAGDQVYFLIDGVVYSCGEDFEVTYGEQYAVKAEQAGKYIMPLDASVTAILLIDEYGYINVSFTGVVGIEDVLASENLAGVRYYNVAGQELSEMQQGLNIVVATMTDGSTVVSKVRK